MTIPYTYSPQAFYESTNNIYYTMITQQELAHSSPEKQHTHAGKTSIIRNEAANTLI